MKTITEEDLLSIEKLCESVRFEQWEPSEFIRKHALNLIAEVRRLKAITPLNVDDASLGCHTNKNNSDSCESSCKNSCNDTCKKLCNKNCKSKLNSCKSCNNNK